MKSSPEFNEEPELISDNIRYEQRRTQQPTPGFLPGKSHGQRSLAGYGVTLSRTRLKQLSMHACITKIKCSHYFCITRILSGLPWWLGSKESTHQCGRRDLVPVLQRSPGEGNGNPLQYSFLENPIDWGAWQATVHGTEKILGDDLVTK